MKSDVDDQNRCRLVCVCKISFIKSVQVWGGCCKMFRGLTFLGHSVYSRTEAPCGLGSVVE